MAAPVAARGKAMVTAPVAFVRVAPASTPTRSRGVCTRRSAPRAAGRTRPGARSGRMSAA